MPSCELENFALQKALFAGSASDVKDSLFLSHSLSFGLVLFFSLSLSVSWSLCATLAVSQKLFDEHQVIVVAGDRSPFFEQTNCSTAGKMSR